MTEILQKLERLERSNRRWKFVVLALLAVVVFSAANRAEFDALTVGELRVTGTVLIGEDIQDPEKPRNSILMFAGKSDDDDIPGVKIVVADEAGGYLHLAAHKGRGGVVTIQGKKGEVKAFSPAWQAVKGNPFEFKK